VKQFPEAWPPDILIRATTRNSWIVLVTNAEVVRSRYAELVMLKLRAAYGLEEASAPPIVS
jgi:hypothetical protein